MIILGVVILLISSEIGNFLIVYFGQTVCNVFEWIADTVWLALIIWASMSIHIDNIVIKNMEHPPKNGSMKRYRWIYGIADYSDCGFNWNDNKRMESICTYYNFILLPIGYNM